MSDYVQKTTELRRLKKLLYRGGQRELARRLGVMPNKVAYAFSGFIKDPEFLGKLVAESKKLIDEKASKELVS